MTAVRIRKSQVKVTTEVCRWYLSRYHRTRFDLGVPLMFQREDLVGHFAVATDEWERGDANAMFRMLVAVTLFQRRQDQQVMRILRGMEASRVREVTSSQALLALADASSCSNLGSQDALIRECDLDKDANGVGTCSKQPTVPCHLKQHTVWLKRYGHFGKVPTSAALMLRESGVQDLANLYRQTVLEHESPRARSIAIDERLRSVWRISEKISAMFLSAACDPNLSTFHAPWAALDPTYFVVIDSNTDLFLEAIGYDGSGTYAARREFLWALAEKIELTEINKDVAPYSPRLVQQAAYLFMSRVNRQASEIDCAHLGQAACDACPAELRTRCGLRGRTRTLVRH